MRQSAQLSSGMRALTGIAPCSEKDLQRQVTVARSQLRELRTTADTNQARLFDHSQRQGASSSDVRLPSTD